MAPKHLIRAQAIRFQCSYDTKIQPPFTSIAVDQHLFHFKLIAKKTGQDPVRTRLNVLTNDINIAINLANEDNVIGYSSLKRE